MDNGLLVFDGSNGAVASIGINRESSYMAELLNREVELVGTLQEARELIGSDSERDFSLLLTEPFMYFEREVHLPEYQQFLRSVKEQRGISIVVWSSQSESTVKDHYGLEKGIHYDSYSCKMSGSPTSDLVRCLEALPV